MYPTTAPEIAIPELDGKTAKMYRWLELVTLLLLGSSLDRQQISDVKDHCS